MKTLIIFILTTLVDYLIDTILVSCALALFVSKNKVKCRSFSTGFALFSFFAFLDVYAIPAMLSVDATFTINDKLIADLLGLGPNARLSQLVSVGSFDVTIWLVQTVVAISIADWIKIKNTESS